MRCISSVPSMMGMRMSVNTTSQRVAFSFSNASSPSSANSSMRNDSSSRSIIRFNLRWACGSSSTIITRIIGFLLSRRSFRRRARP